ncbi:ABC transporter ATP-binding protein [Nocardioides sp. KR10-350]|uniref:ABC transporter ATP-binding protein n=1 Tax=Nocardioides cheoyonin TaxID=3156615 RepID=UPI0032B46F02
MTTSTLQGSGIAIRRVSKVFPASSGPVQALTGVDLDVREGEIVTLVGTSGCGKSTLLNIVAGLERPTEGEVTVSGRPVTGPGPDRGVIFQQYALFPWLTVAGNVEFGLRLQGVRRREAAATARRYLELVDLAGFADALPKELSGGMRQRVAIARAYAVNPSILLMDEPFGALDAVTRVELQDQLLRAWSAEPKTIVFVTHDVEEAVYLADRVVVMSPRPGRVSEVIDVDLPHPRTEQTRLSEDFLALRAHVWERVFHGRDLPRPR